MQKSLCVGMRGPTTVNEYHSLCLQVYRARLRDGGREVAVKVQRPGVKESIALDIYILRSLAVVIRQWRKINSDLGEILDEAGCHYLHVPLLRFVNPCQVPLSASSCDGGTERLIHLTLRILLP